MKKFFNLLILIFLFVFLFWQKETLVSNVKFLLASRCDTAIAYRLGTVDKGYGLSEEQFLTDIKEATQIWDKVVGKNLFPKEKTSGASLFVYDPKASLQINLLYTEKQVLLDKLGGLEKDLKAGKSSLDSQVGEYKNLVASFEQRLKVFNEEVRFWNKQGGAPEDVFERLTQEQNDLKAEAERLNNLAQSLNLSVEQYNLEVGQFNKTAQTYKAEVVAKPEAGLYDSTIPKIDIYLTTSQKELIHTLAHEFGHALSLPHVNNKEAVMYPLSTEVIIPIIEEEQMLINICQQKNMELVFKVLSLDLADKLRQLSKILPLTI